MDRTQHTHTQSLPWACPKYIRRDTFVVTRNENVAYNIASDAADGRYIIILYSSLFLYTNDAIHDVVDADREVSTHRIFILDTHVRATILHV